MFYFLEELLQAINKDLENFEKKVVTNSEQNKSNKQNNKGEKWQNR